jgi:arylsulfatase A-like enzyme
MNLLPIVSGAAPETERTLFWRVNNATAVRSGDMKLIVQGGTTFVYDVGADPGERNDLTNVSQDEARRLQGLLTEWVTDVDAERATRVPAR